MGMTPSEIDDLAHTFGANSYVQVNYVPGGHILDGQGSFELEDSEKSLLWQLLSNEATYRRYFQGNLKNYLQNHYKDIIQIAANNNIDPERKAEKVGSLIEDCVRQMLRSDIEESFKLDENLVGCFLDNAYFVHNSHGENLERLVNKLNKYKHLVLSEAAFTQFQEKGITLAAPDIEVLPNDKIPPHISFGSSSRFRIIETLYDSDTHKKLINPNLREWSFNV